MSEAIISRRGSKQSSKPSGSLITHIVDDNRIWTVPEGIINNTISVRLFGGGGGGYSYSGRMDSNQWSYTTRFGGGGGEMNNGEVKLPAGYEVEISIGKGGTGVYYKSTFNGVFGGTGGTTSFGIWLAANGGGCPDGGSGGGTYTDYTYATGKLRYGGNATQFGGGAGWFGAADQQLHQGTKGGKGGIWGGGGAGLWFGGDGGIYGGGGWGSEGGGKGGIYGGNGGTGPGVYTINGISPQDGTNTINNKNVPINCQGEGLSGLNLRRRLGADDSINNRYGGGGGYGGNGGTIDGGGGGYGGNGGGPFTFQYNVFIGEWIGGGGGYGKGADGGWYYGGGGGYFASGGNGEAGGGGSYGRGAGCKIAHNGNNWLTITSTVLPAMYGGGGSGFYRNIKDGANGICIIQYYTNI